MLSAIWRRKWLIALLTLLCAALAWAIVSRMTPLYTARAAVMLDARSVQVLDGIDVVSDLTLNNPVLDSEVTVLRSNLLLHDVLDRFAPEELAPLDPAAVAPSALSRVTGGAKAWIKDLLGEADDAAPAAVPALSPEERRQRRLTGALRNAMTVWREGQSYVISVSVETRDPALSQRLANAVVTTYIDRQLAERTEAVRGATSFLGDRLETLRADVETAETAVEDFRRDQLAAGGATAESLERQLIDLSTQTAVASAELAAAEARARQIRSIVEAQGLEAAAELLTSPFVLSLREEKSELEREDLALSARLGEDHPDRIRIGAAIDAITDTLTDEVRKIIATLENEVSVASIREQSLRDSLAALEQRAAELSRASLDLRQLERQAEAVRESYEQVLERTNETQSVEELQRADAVIIERATLPGAPSSPRVALFTAFGAVLGFAAGLVLTVLLSLLRQGFVRASDLESATGLPVAVALPKVRWRSPKRMLQSIAKSPYQPYVERLRQLRSGLDGAGDAAPRSVLIASSVPGEGKTTVSVAFSKLEAISGRSCLLLDLDMRKSSLARDLGYAPEGGRDLAEVFTGAAGLDEAICRSAARGFDLLTTRKPSPQVFDQRTSADFESLLTELTSRYDRVVVDTAPILSVADTLPVVRHADATVLLVRTRFAPERAVSEALWRLRNMGARGINLVFSVVDGREGGESYGADRVYLNS